MATGRGGNKIKSKLGFLVYGEQGTWKSSLCLEFMKMKREDGKPFRVLYIDAEQGSIDDYLDDYADEGYDLRNIYIVYTQSLSEVKDFIKKAKEDEDFYNFDDDGNETDEVYLDAEGKPFRPDAVVVDGITVLYIARQQGIIEFSKKRATVRATKNEVTGMAREVAIEGAGLEIKDYNTLKFNGQDLILDLMGCGKHFAVTCREEDEKEQYKDKNGEIKMMATGRKQPAGFKDVRYNVKTVIHMFKDSDGVIKGIIENKDRTKVHKQDELLIEPSLLDWQTIIDRGKDKKDFNVANNLNSSVDRELESIEKDNARFDEEESNSEKTKEAVLTTAKDYQEAIQKAIGKLKDMDKTKAMSVITKAGFPKAYQRITDIEVLKQYLETINGVK